MNNISENSSYVILVNDDNTMTTTKKRRIMQRSKLIDELCFLVKPEYNGYNMADFTVSLEYLCPVSRKYRTEILVLSEDTYNGYLKYELPFDTSFTAEAGTVEIMITFLLVELNDKGRSIQRVRKISSTTVDITPIAAWSDIIPDCALSALDQRIIKMDAQIRAINDMTQVIVDEKADDLSYNTDTCELQLLANNKPIGRKVHIKSDDDNEDDVVDFDKGDNNESGSGSGSDDEDGNDVVEF